MKKLMALLVVLAAVIAIAMGSRESKPDQSGALRQLRQKVAHLQAQRAEAIIDRDAARHERDSLRAALRPRVALLHVQRDSLPPSTEGYDADSLYRRALATLDTAFVIIGYQDEIIRRDSLDRVRSDSIDAYASREIASLYNMVELQAAETKAERRKAYVWKAVAFVEAGFIALRALR